MKLHVPIIILRCPTHQKETSQVDPAVSTATITTFGDSYCWKLDRLPTIKHGPNEKLYPFQKTWRKRGSETPGMIRRLCGKLWKEEPCMLDERMIKATHEYVGDNEEVETDHTRLLV